MFCMDTGETNNDYARCVCLDGLVLLEANTQLPYKTSRIMVKVTAKITHTAQSHNLTVV